MIPSDHFVRFYNEVFKFLDSRGDLEKYYLHISQHQEYHCLEDFRTKKLQGVYEYYLKIRKEENCDLDLERSEHCLLLRMNRCPSLTKAMDNDAGLCKKYCLHCPGWTMPLYRKAGLFQIFAVMGLEDPRCCEWIFEEKSRAEEKYQELLSSVPEDQLLKNF